MSISDTKPVGEGTGLGLSLCYGIISQYGGRIWAESTAGEGSSFYVALPIVPDAAGPLERSGPPAAVERLQHRRRNVLVIDDEEPIRLLLVRLLEEIGHDAVAARSGEEALQLLARRDFDLIMTNIKMPGMNGFELFKQIYRRWPSALSSPPEIRSAH